MKEEPKSNLPTIAQIYADQDLQVIQKHALFQTLVNQERTDKLFKWCYK